MLASREEWYLALQEEFRDASGAGGMQRSHRPTPFVARVVSDDNKKDISEIVYDKYLFTHQYYIEVGLL